MTIHKIIIGLVSPLLLISLVSCGPKHRSNSKSGGTDTAITDEQLDEIVKKYNSFATKEDEKKAWDEVGSKELAKLVASDKLNGEDLFHFNNYGHVTTRDEKIREIITALLDEKDYIAKSNGWRNTPIWFMVSFGRNNNADLVLKWFKAGGRHNKDTSENYGYFLRTIWAASKDPKILESAMTSLPDNSDAQSKAIYNFLSDPNLSLTQLFTSGFTLTEVIKPFDKRNARFLIQKLAKLDRSILEGMRNDLLSLINKVNDKSALQQDLRGTDSGEQYIRSLLN